MEYVKHERLWLKKHNQFNEKWVQSKIAADPSILGLGDVLLKNEELIQYKAGRLDLLLFDPESYKRYELELQLGTVDESHIIRTIEYWDIERKRYPQYEHTAVIIAEEITGRFLNVISLFNGTIPIIALQMSAIQMGGLMTLLFTKVLDEVGLAFEEDDAGEPSDRNYWEKRSSKESLELADDVIKLINMFAPEYALKYNKHYIGLVSTAGANNFVAFRPKRSFIQLFIKLSKSEEIQEQLDATQLDVMGYDGSWGNYRIRLTKKDLKENSALLSELMKRAHQRSIE